MAEMRGFRVESEQRLNGYVKNDTVTRKMN
jgi:hypothetical protein